MSPEFREIVKEILCLIRDRLIDYSLYKKHRYRVFKFRIKCLDSITRKLAKFTLFIEFFIFIILTLSFSFTMLIIHYPFIVPSLANATNLYFIFILSPFILFHPFLLIFCFFKTYLLIRLILSDLIDSSVLQLFLIIDLYILFYIFIDGYRFLSILFSFLEKYRPPDYVNDYVSEAKRVLRDLDRKYAQSRKNK